MGVYIKTKRSAKNNDVLNAFYSGEPIPFVRKTRAEQSTRLQIKVLPDCTVTALAPDSASDAAVVKAVQKRGHWISKQLRDFREQNAHVIPRQYISGESHCYLGRQYVLKVYADSQQKADEGGAVKLLRGKLEVTVQRQSPDVVKAALDDWYKTRARMVFQQRLDNLLPKTMWVEASPPVRVYAMKTQWGNCSPAGRLTLNPHLVKAPSVCIDYVLLHELCHLAEHNHSNRFYRLMSQVMPNWQDVKIRLDQMAARLLV